MRKGIPAEAELTAVREGRVKWEKKSETRDAFSLGMGLPARGRLGSGFLQERAESPLELISFLCLTDGFQNAPPEAAKFNSQTGEQLEWRGGAQQRGRQEERDFCSEEKVWELSPFAKSGRPLLELSCGRTARGSCAPDVKAPLRSGSLKGLCQSPCSFVQRNCAPRFFPLPFVVVCSVRSSAVFSFYLAEKFLRFHLRELASSRPATSSACAIALWAEGGENGERFLVWKEPSSVGGLDL